MAAGPALPVPAADGTTRLRSRLRGLYAITPDGLAPDILQARTEQVLAGGASVLQYRAKTADALRRLQEATALRRLAHARGALFIVNDDPLLAALAGADGVHLGQGDGAARDVRAAHPGLLVGVTCHDQIALAREAQQQGADYVAFGALAPSPTKPQAVRAPLSVLGEARALGLAVVAIGGITPDLARAAWGAGADAVAVVSALYDAPDPAAAARTFLAGYPGHG